MDRFTREKLHLAPRTDEQLQMVIDTFERKWQSKAERLMGREARSM